MPFFIKSVLSSERAVVAGEQVTYDLPVNPLSYIDLRLTALQSALNTLIDPTDFLGYITSVEVLWRGASIVSVSLRDLAMVAGVLGGYWPDLQNHGNLASQRVSMVFKIPFGRKLFWTSEILPPVRRGELQLRLTYAATLTDASSLIEHIETLEVPDATPSRFLKYTTLPKTPSAAGDHDVDLPIGNPLVGMLLFSTTVPAGATETTSIDAVKLLVDNVEFFYPLSRWEEVHADFLRRSNGGLARIWNHQHMYDPTLVAANQTTDRAQGATYDLRQYGYLDFDPLVDPDMGYSLVTAGRARVNLRISADDVAAIRVIPIEVIPIAPRGA